MARHHVPIVHGDRLDAGFIEGTAQSELRIGSQDWFAWIDAHDAFSYKGTGGVFSARRERRHGGWYWYAYRKWRGRLQKEYLGLPGDLTLPRLAHVATQLANIAADPEAGRHSPMLLMTKLFAPQPRDQLIARPRLITLLEASRESLLVLLSAPAGAGKTTLLGEWLTRLELPVGWLTLDASDRDPHQFVRYLIAALQSIAPGCGQDALVWLDTPPPPPSEVVLTRVLNELATDGKAGLLVLDDYHLVRESSIHHAVQFLLDNLPPNMRLVIATREDPPLPLPRLRGRGQLTELRGVDLNFTADEAATFLNQRVGVRLTREQLASVAERIEGWAAGLQLAVLALRDRDDPAAFLAAFAGSQRLVADYLTAEVLDRQSPAIRRFLLASSVLHRICAPLCDVLLTGFPETFERDSQHVLEELERTNVFLVPLDEEQHWYRYHHLFADALRARLAREAGDATTRVLHERASAWFEQNGLLGEAIEHALSAGAVDRAADLIERAAPATSFTHVLGSLNGWLSAIPAAVVETRPALALPDAWRFIQAGDAALVERRLEAAERALGVPTNAPDRNLRGEAAATRALVELGRAEPLPESIIAAAERALGDLHPDNTHWIGVSGICLGSAALLAGDGPRAEAVLAEAVRLGRGTGNHHLALGAASYLCAAQRALGARQRALATAREALGWAAESGTTSGARLDTLDVQLADLLREENDLPAAEAHATEAITLFRRWGLGPKLCYSLFALARVRHAQGDFDGAVDALDEARALSATSATSWSVLDAFAVQVALARGDLSAAMRWAAALPAQTPGPRPAPAVLMFAYECECLRIAPAQAWLAHGRAHSNQAAIARALDLLEKERAAADALGWGWLRLKVAALEALARDALGDRDRAMAMLQSAVRLAEPDGWVRLFADEGAPMAALLSGFHGVSAPYLKSLISAAEGAVPAAGSTAIEPRGTSLAEPLSVRELEVLSLIAAGRSTTEIAQALVVADSTVKTHTSNIFGKLGVNRRTLAVARARDLGLLS
ncbi:MAG TPA: LuxR C-terminal-related transcriptional regulator [Chloroflexota bacterium]